MPLWCCGGKHKGDHAQNRWEFRVGPYQALLLYYGIYSGGKMKHIMIGKHQYLEVRPRTSFLSTEDQMCDPYFLQL